MRYYHLTLTHQIQGNDGMNQSFFPSPSVAASTALQQAELQHCFWRVSLLQQGMCAPHSVTDSCRLYEGLLCTVSRYST